MTIAPDQAFRLETQVALRPEPFGALAYHYGNRRLVFLRSPEMVRLVEALADAPDVAAAMEMVGIGAAQRDNYLEALGTLEEAGVIHARR